MFTLKEALKTYASDVVGLLNPMLIRDGRTSRDDINSLLEKAAHLKRLKYRRSIYDSAMQIIGEVMQPDSSHEDYQEQISNEADSAVTYYHKAFEILDACENAMSNVDQALDDGLIDSSLWSKEEHCGSIICKLAYWCYYYDLHGLISSILDTSSDTYAAERLQLFGGPIAESDTAESVSLIDELAKPASPTDEAK